MAFSKRIRFGRRAPLGLLRLEFSSELDAKGGERTVDFRWEPEPRRHDSDERSQRPVDE